MSQPVCCQTLRDRWDTFSIPLPVLIRWALAAYFLYSGYVKVDDTVVFLKNIRLYHLLPESPPIFLNASAVILPWLEIVCGLALLAGVMTRGAALNLAMMLAVFTPAIFLRGLAISHEQGISFFDVEFDCGCGAGPQITWIKLCKNSALFLAAIATVFSQSCRFSLSVWWRGANNTCPSPDAAPGATG